MAKEERHINRLNMISKGWNLVFAIILLIIALLVIIPMVLIVIISFSSELSIANKGFSFFPDEWTLNGYKYLFKTGDQLLDSYLITIFYSITGTVMSLSVMTMYAYVISQRNFKHCRFLTWFLFFTMLFSGGSGPGLHPERTLPAYQQYSMDIIIPVDILQTTITIRLLTYIRTINYIAAHKAALHLQVNI